MSRTLLVAVLPILLAGETLAQCLPNQFDPPPTVRETTCSTNERFLHFLGSKGAYATALFWGTAANTAAAECNVNVLPPSILNRKSCVHFTGECSAALPGTSACSTDPSSLAGEISCQCFHGPPVRDNSTPTNPSHFPFQGHLGIDRNVDRTIDDVFVDSNSVAAWRGIGAPPFLARQVAPDYFVFDWEDDFPLTKAKTLSADYNDYSLGWEFRACGATGFPTHTLGAKAKCHDPCVVNGCGELDSFLDSSFKAYVAMAVDNSTTEIPLEANGRLLTLTLNQYSNLTVGAPELATNVAVCPVVNFRWQNPPTQLEAETFDVTYGRSDSTCVATSTQPLGAPSCIGSPRLSQLTLPVALSQFQATLPRQCPPASGFDESFRFEPRDTCGPSLRSTAFELRLSDLDAALTRRNSFSKLSSSQLLSSIESVDLFFFWNLSPNSIPFQCPSGVGLTVGQIDRQVGQVFKQHISSSDINFAGLVRRN